MQLEGQAGALRRAAGDCEGDGDGQGGGARNPSRRKRAARPRRPRPYRTAPVRRRRRPGGPEKGKEMRGLAQEAEGEGGGSAGGAQPPSPTLRPPPARGKASLLARVRVRAARGPMPPPQQPGFAPAGSSMPPSAARVLAAGSSCRLSSPGPGHGAPPHPHPGTSCPSVPPGPARAGAPPAAARAPLRSAAGPPRPLPRRGRTPPLEAR